MKRKMALMLLIGAIALCLVGCGEDEEVATTTDQGDTATSQAPAGEGTVQPVPEGQGGTAGTAGTETTPGGAAGTGTQATAQQKAAYVEGAEKILSNMEQKLTAWQQQAGTQEGQGQQKMQELSKQVQQEIADARAAVEKMRAATGPQVNDAKMAADTAIQDAEQAFKNLQSFVNQQVTQAQ